jgi:drug/metabolite transporter (DMT)-like permease
MTSDRHMIPTEWALLALLSLLWGGSFVFAKIAVQALSPLTVVLVRVALAAFALALYLGWRGTAWPRGARVWRAFFGMGVLNNLIPFLLLFWAQTVLSSSLASVLNATTPLFSLLVAHAVASNERLAMNKLIGIGLGVAGVAVLVGVEALTQSNPTLLPVLACLGAALSYGFASVFGRRFTRLGIDPVVGAFGQTAATSVMILPLVLAFAAPWRSVSLDAQTWAALIGLALLSTALAYVLFFRLLASAGAINTSLVTLLIPVSAILLGSTLLGERLTGPQVGGMLLIGSGLLAIDGRVLPRRRIRA